MGAVGLPGAPALPASAATPLAVPVVEHRRHSMRTKPGQHLSATPAGLAAEVDWREGCPAFQRAARAGGVAARYVEQQAALMREIAAALPEHGRALVISHGGIVEAGAVGCRPDDDFASWGAACGYCEGVRLTFEANRCVAAELLRVPGSVLEN